MQFTSDLRLRSYNSSWDTCTVEQSSADQGSTSCSQRPLNDDGSGHRLPATHVEGTVPAVRARELGSRSSCSLCLSDNNNDCKNNVGWLSGQALFRVRPQGRLPDSSHSHCLTHTAAHRPCSLHGSGSRAMGSLAVLENGTSQ